MNSMTEDTLLKDIENIEDYNDLKEIRLETEEIIEGIQSDGYDLNESFDVFHFLTALKFENLEECVIELDTLFEGIEYDGPVEDQEGSSSSPIFQVSIIRNTILDIEIMMTEIAKIVQICNKYNVAYDGWGVQVDSEE
jgi:regulator of RNase E activity RraB